MYKWRQAIQQQGPYRLPALCRLCGLYHRDQHAICQQCTHLIEPLGPACQSCAAPLPNQAPFICGTCCSHPPEINTVLTHHRFTEPLRTLLHAFKYEAALYLTSFLANLMLCAKPETYHTDCLIPVPLHSSRLQQRGFNQAAVLALYLSRIIKKPCELYPCEKIISTAPQAGLTATQRHSNLKHAFRARPLPYKHITLIDDLFTTGATAHEIAKTLKQQGVQQVDLWCCARAIPKKN